MHELLLPALLRQMPKVIATTVLATVRHQMASISLAAIDAQNADLGFTEIGITLLAQAPTQIRICFAGHLMPSADLH